MKKYLFALGYTQETSLSPLPFWASILHIYITGKYDLYCIGWRDALGKKALPFQHNQSGYLPLFLKIQNHINSNIKQLNTEDIGEMKLTEQQKKELISWLENVTIYIRMSQEFLR